MKYLKYLHLLPGCTIQRQSWILNPGILVWNEGILSAKPNTCSIREFFLEDITHGLWRMGVEKKQQQDYGNCIAVHLARLRTSNLKLPFGDPDLPTGLELISTK